MAADGLAPEPEAFGAGVYGWAHAEAVGAVQQHPVQQVALAGAVHAGDRDDGQGGSDRRQHGAGLRGHLVFLRGLAVADEHDGLLFEHLN